MRWWVKLGGRLVGWVIAASEPEALKHAAVKFPARDFEPYEVEPRARKRKR